MAIFNNLQRFFLKIFQSHEVFLNSLIVPLAVDGWRFMTPYFGNLGKPTKPTLLYQQVRMYYLRSFGVGGRQTRDCGG